jgi:opacity protein-like surface antigen
MVMAVVLAGATPAQATDLLPRPGSWELGLRSGYSISPRNVDMVPVNIRIGYTLFKGKKWVIPPGALEVGVEPFVSVITSVTHPDKRSGSIELGGVLPVLTYYFDLGGRIYPYLEGGLGMLYTDLRGYNLGGHFSFLETVGAGVTYFLNDTLALNAGWRYRHISNAEIYKDNAGLDSFIFLAGVSYFLPPR